MSGDNHLHDEVCGDPCDRLISPLLDNTVCSNATAACSVLNNNPSVTACDNIDSGSRQSSGNTTTNSSQSSGNTAADNSQSSGNTAANSSQSSCSIVANSSQSSDNTASCEDSDVAADDPYRSRCSLPDTSQLATDSALCLFDANSAVTSSEISPSPASGASPPSTSTDFRPTGSASWLQQSRVGPLCRQCGQAVAPAGPDSVRKVGANRICCDRLWRTLRTLRLRRPARFTAGRSLSPTCTQCSCSCSSGNATVSDAVSGRERAPISQSISTVHSQQQQRTVHTTVDFVHCLVPELRVITDKPYYWGRIDRYHAERLLDSRPEGTFLLRDSAQEEHLFSVSFRRYDRSLHARIEQSAARFTFDAHDPSVFSSATISALIDHYKDPSCCNFFEPLLTAPLHRTDVFSLAHLCRAVIVSLLNYDDINRLPLPRALRLFLMEYHYKQRVGVRRLELSE